MTKEVYISATNCITPLGFDVATNINSILNGETGIKQYTDINLLHNPYFAAVVDDAPLNDAFSRLEASGNFSKLEKMLVLALQPVIKQAGIEINDRVALILSTTKGNVTELDKLPEGSIEGAYLQNLAKKVARYFGFTTEPIVVSNACVSGVLAIAVAKRMIQMNRFDHAFVLAGDLVSGFVLSGFNSFQAMGSGPCKPYSKNRDGVTLGEAAAAVLVTTDKANVKMKILGDGSINDANHISGPSRTGEGLYRSISGAMAEAGLKPSNIDYICAHGTATPFNDEMEAIALDRLGLTVTPVNSLKGYYGHTLGASGLLETVIGIQSVLDNMLFRSLGFDELGVSKGINIIEENTSKEMRYFLKTASGFGGSNAAIVLEKVN